MKTTVLIALGFLFFNAKSSGDSVFSPDIPLSSANGGGRGPFLMTSDSAPSYRLQEVHGAADFARADNLTLLITGMSYAARLGSAPIDVTVSSVEIHLSTTTRNPDSLSFTFAENIGANETTVFSGSLRLYDTAPGDYGIQIEFQTPFLYDYRAGNLLLDVRNFATIPPPPSGQYNLYAHSEAADSVSGVGNINVNAPTGFLGTAGYLTEFTVTPVPEPSTWLLLLIAVPIGVLFHQRSRAKRTPTRP